MGKNTEFKLFISNLEEKQKFLKIFLNMSEAHFASFEEICHHIPDDRWLISQSTQSQHDIVLSSLKSL